MDAVDPVSDFLTLNGMLLRGVTLASYDPSEDVDSNNPWAAPVKIRGSRGPKRVVATNGSGDIAATLATWTITGLTADVDLDRPTLRSKIIQGGETWIILNVEADPIMGRLYECETQLIEG